MSKELDKCRTMLDAINNKEEKKDNVVVDLIFGTILGLGLTIPLYMLCGFVLADLWLWFVVPLGVVAIGKAHACGLIGLIYLMTNIGKHRYEPADMDNHGLTYRMIVLSLCISLGLLIVWGLGAILVTLM